jgi:hypothetical protein
LENIFRYCMPDWVGSAVQAELSMPVPVRL